MGGGAGDRDGVAAGLDDVLVEEDGFLVDHVGFGSKPPGSLQRNYICEAKC